MSRPEQPESVTVKLHGGSRDGDTSRIHARTVEKHDAIMVPPLSAGNPFPVQYKHAAEADTDDNYYVPEWEVSSDD